MQPDRWTPRRVSSAHRGSITEGLGVTLINTDGMSFIGPGSEWFWTALSAIVVAVTFLAIFRQLQLQRSAAAIDQLNDLIHEWSSERLCRAKYNVLRALEAGRKGADLPNRPVATVGVFWQRVGFLVRGGHIDRELVYANLGDQAQVWWKLIYGEKPAATASIGEDSGWTSPGSSACRLRRTPSGASIAISTPT